MNQARFLIGIVATGAIALFVFSVGNWQSQTGNVNQSTLSVGTNIWPGYEPLYLARELGYFKGEQVHLVEFASSSQVMHAFRNNVISAAAVTLDEVLLLKDYGLDPKVILIFDISEGADVILAAHDIPNMAALKGKRIGVENTALGAFVLMRALELNHLSLRDVSLVSLPINEHDNAFASGKVDALVTFDPVRTRLMNEGNHEIFTSREIPGEIVDLLIVNAETLASHQEQIDALFSGHFRAVEYLRSNPKAAASIMSKRQKISEQEVLDSYQGVHLPDLKENLKILGTPNPPLRENAQRLAEMMHRSQLLKNTFNVESLTVSEPLFRLAHPDPK